MTNNQLLKPEVRQVVGCRNCGSQSLNRFLHLPNMPFTDDFIPQQQLGHEFLADIDVFVCQHCLTAQTQHDVEVGEYYEDYQYSVGSSAIASGFMKRLAENLKARYYPARDNKRVLEVGSGDGEQLVAFKDTGCRVLGYEPSSELCRIAKQKGVPTIQGLFNAESASELPEDFNAVDVIMLSYTFDHLPDPKGFLHTACSLLNKTDGLLVVEIHDLEKIIERKEYCLFEHEHSIYMTEATVQGMCRGAGLEVIDFDIVAQNDRRANSLIFVATPADSALAEQKCDPRTPAEYQSLEFYNRVSADIESGIRNLDAFVDSITNSGQTLAGYSAGGRGVMTLAAMQNARKLTYLVDRKPKRSGMFVPKSRIPLVGLDALKSDPVDQILVFSFGYMSEIQKEVGAFGYKPEQFHSLIDVLAEKLG